MQVIDLDGNTSNWSIGGLSSNKPVNKSSYHLTARDLVSKIYPTMQVLEEVPISIRRSETLYLDFYIPLIKKCIEVHGEQHYKFIPHYHANKLAFLKAQKRDKDKQEWCRINNIEYIELSYESPEKWEEILVNN